MEDRVLDENTFRSTLRAVRPMMQWTRLGLEQVLTKQMVQCRTLVSHAHSDSIFRATFHLRSVFCSSSVGPPRLVARAKETRVQQNGELIWFMYIDCRTDVRFTATPMTVNFESGPHSAHAGTPTSAR